MNTKPANVFKIILYFLCALSFTSSNSFASKCSDAVAADLQMVREFSQEKLNDKSSIRDGSISDKIIPYHGEVPKYFQKLLNKIDKKGGEASLREILTDKPRQKPFLIIEVLKPPTTPIFGIAFKEIFEVAKKNDYPVLLTPLPNLFLRILTYLIPTYGMVVQPEVFQEDADGILLIHPELIGNTVLRHERVHISDIRENPDNFLRSLNLTEEEFNKIKMGQHESGTFNSLKYKLFKTFITGHLELRAQSGTWDDLMTLRGIRETFLTRTVLKEMYALLDTLMNEMKWGSKTAVASIIIQPKNVKANTVYLFRGFTGFVLVMAFAILIASSTVA